MQEKTWYAVYDTEGNEPCVGVFKGGEEIADFFNMEVKSVYSCISRGYKLQKRYTIFKLGEDINV